METLIQVDTSRRKRSFLDFIYRVYAGNPCYKDSLVPIVRTFLERSDVFTATAFIRPLQVLSQGAVAAQCVLVHHPKLPVLQIAFFEALPERRPAVERLISEARAEAHRRGLKRIVAGLNGHLAYGVGFLTDAFRVPCPFDSLYTPEYYLSYWEPHAVATQTLSTYRFVLSETILPVPVVRRASTRFRFRTMDMNHFKAEAMLLGELANRFLKETHLYFERDPSDMYQLLRPLRPLLRSEHLLFACRDGKEIGFLFWHPDFNAILPGGRRSSTLGSGLRCLLGGRRIRVAKLNAAGVDPRYHGTSVVAGLLQELIRSCRGRYEAIETNFVWDSNRKSSLLNRHFPHREARHYKTFELDAAAPRPVTDCAPSSGEDRR
jgi:hypothetical protein